MSQTDVSQDYFAVITDAGAALEAAAHAKGLPVKLTHIAVGDGNGEVPQPVRTATALVNEVYRREIDSSRIDTDDPNVCWISAVIPATVGGFWIREFGIYAESLEEDGEPVLYGYGNHAPYYKVDKILGQASTHELEIPVIMSGAANIQIAVKDSGYASQSAFNGLAAQVGQMKIVDQEYGARLTALEVWQLAHAIAEIGKLGLIQPDGVTIAIKPDGTISVAQGPHWLFGEFYFFRHPTLRDGFEVLDGGVIENGAEMYPDFWDYIQTSEGQLLCLTATEREALANHVYYTLADGTPVTYGGVGGVPYFTIDTATGKIVMPDIRGMFLEAAGFNSLNVGGVDIDRMRNLDGTLTGMGGSTGTWTGVYTKDVGANMTINNSGTDPNLKWQTVHFYSNRVAPTGPANAPRRFGVLACAYMGMPVL